MSESRGTETGPSDRGGETMKDSEGKGKEEAEEPSKEDVSEEQNSLSSSNSVSSSNPPLSEEVEEKSREGLSEEESPFSSSNPPPLEEASVADTRVSDNKNVRDESLDSGSPLKKQKQKQSSLAPKAAAPQAESGDPSEGSNQEVQPNTKDSDSDPDDDNDDWPDEFLLFEMEAPRTNRLVIPFELASTHFPDLNTRKPNEKQFETLQLTDTLNHEWYMPIQYYHDERGFMIISGWQQFSTQYDLKHMDLILISEPVPRLHENHFLIEFERNYQSVENFEFKEENFLFHVVLDRSDIEFRRLFLDREDVRNFPGVKMERKSKMKKIMRFTDARSKDWYMDIVRYDEKKYMVIGGWDEFVKERGLKAGDFIVFFQHMNPCHRKHYLIGIVRKESVSNPGRPGGGDRAAGGGAGTSGSGDRAAGGGAGTSGSYKGKEIVGAD